MRGVVVCLVAAGVAIGPPQKAQSEAEILTAKLKAAEQDGRLARLEGLVLREQIATQQLEKIRADQQALYGEACKAAGIEPDPKICVIDLNARTVTRAGEKGK